MHSSRQIVCHCRLLAYVFIFGNNEFNRRNKKVSHKIWKEQWTTLLFKSACWCLRMDERRQGWIRNSSFYRGMSARKLLIFDHDGPAYYCNVASWQARWRTSSLVRTYIVYARIVLFFECKQKLKLWKWVSPLTFRVACKSGKGYCCNFFSLFWRRPTSQSSIFLLLPNNPAQKCLVDTTNTTLFFQAWKVTECYKLTFKVWE